MTNHPIGHLIQLATLALLCLGILLFAPAPTSIIAFFPMLIFLGFFLLELYFLLGKDKP